jgi:hypothetical protein
MPPAVPAPRIPDYRGACVAGIVPALLGPGGTRDLPDWCPASLRGAERVAVLVLDGLGWHQWRARLDRCPVLASMDAARIDTVAPTTTVAALTSITTGLAPAEHGLVGYRMALGGRIAQMLRWGADGADLRAAHPPERVQPCPPFLGAAVPVVSRAEFEDTAFTHAHLRGGRHHGWRVASSLAVTVGSLLREGERFVYAYYDGVDKVAHERGFGPHYDAELATADALVGAVRDALPRGAALVVTADHGQVQVGAATREPDPAVLALTERQSGEGRFRWLHARAGAVDELAARAAAAHGDVAHVATRERILDEGWLGPVVSPAARARLGDVAMVPHADVSFDDPLEHHGPPLVCRHGALTDAEMDVPLLVARG